MYKCTYIQYIQGLCQSRLSTANYALLLIAPATTAVLRSYYLISSQHGPRTENTTFTVAHSLPRDVFTKSLPTNGLFTKNSSSRERVCRPLPSNALHKSVTISLREWTTAPVPKKHHLIYEYNFLLRNITLQHPVALIMVCRGSLAGATSCRACRLPVCSAVTFV
jgi:hypothetical protein